MRAITGDLVITGEFTVNHELKLLDLTKLEQLSQGSYHLFDPDFSEKSKKSYFLKRLMFLLSKPASNRQNSSYLETQVIFEFNEWHQPEHGYYSYRSSKIIESENNKTNSILNFVEESLKLHYIEAVKTVAKEQSIQISLED